MHVLLTGLMFVVIICLACSTGRKIIVDDDNGRWTEFNTIQEAVDSARVGDRLRVYAGIYRENLVIDKKISIIGNGTTTRVHGVGKGHVVAVNKSGVEVLRIKASNATEYPFAGISITANNCRIAESLITNNYFGIHLSGGGGSTIEDNNCSNNIGDGIFLDRTDENILINNTIFRNNEPSDPAGERIGSWKLGESGLDGTPGEVKDSSNKGRNGASSGYPSSVNRGTIDGSIWFDGGDDEITIPSIGDLGLHGSLQLEARLYSENIVSSGDIALGRLEFEDGGCYSPQPVDLGSGIIGIVYRNQQLRGVLATVYIDRGSAILIDSRELVDDVFLDHSAIKASNGSIAVAYRDGSGTGWLLHVETALNGSIGGVNSLQVSGKKCYDPVIFSPHDDIVALACTGLTGDGKVYTYSIAGGSLSGPLDASTFSEGPLEPTDHAILENGTVIISLLRGGEGVLVQISVDRDGLVHEDILETSLPGHLASLKLADASGDRIIAVSGGDIGWLYTVGLAENGSMTEVIDDLVYSDAPCSDPDISMVTSRVHSIAYRDQGGRGRITSVFVSPAGWITQTLLDTVEFEDAIAYEPVVLPAGDDVQVVVYRGKGANGILSIHEIDNDGAIFRQHLPFESGGSVEQVVVRISEGLFGIAYADSKGRGRLCTVSASEKEGISAVPIDSIMFEPELASDLSIAEVSSNMWAVAYTGPGGKGNLATLKIGEDGMIRDMPRDRFLFEPLVCEKPDIIKVKGSMYAITYGAGNGTVKILSMLINKNGTVGGLYSDHYLESGGSPDPELQLVSSGVAALVYSGNSTGELATLHFDDNGTITRIENLTFDQNSTEDPGISLLGGDLYTLKYTSNGSGFIRTAKIWSDGTVIEGVDELQLGIGRCEGLRQTVVASTTMAVLYSGDDCRGTLATFEIWPDGTIGGLIDETEFDEVMNAPVFAKASGDLHLIAYSDIHSSGILYTMDIPINGTLEEAPIRISQFARAQISDISVLSPADGILAVAFNSGGSGLVRTFALEDGVLGGAIDACILEDRDATSIEIFHIKGNLFGAVYTGNGGKGLLETFKISSTGNIFDVDTATMVFEPALCLDPDASVSDGFITIAYESVGRAGLVRTIQYGIDGSLGPSIDVEEFSDTASSPSSLIIENGILCIAFTGAETQGRFTTLALKGNGRISGPEDEFIFASVRCLDPDLIQVDNQIVAVVYSGQSDNGMIRSISLDGAGGIDSLVDTIMFSEGPVRDPTIKRLTDDVYGIAYSAGSRGALATLRITMNGTLGPGLHDQIVLDVPGCSGIAIYPGADDAFILACGVDAGSIVSTGRIVDGYKGKGIFAGQSFGITVEGGQAIGVVNGRRFHGTAVSGWNHVSLSYDPSRENDAVLLYVNGKLEASGGPAGSIEWAGPLIIGRHFRGYIDEVLMRDQASSTLQLRSPLLGGIHLWLSDNNTILDNSITANERGIHIRHSWGNLIEGNLVRANEGHGCEFDGSGDGNTVRSNWFSMNGIGVARSIGPQVDAERNYWEHPSGPFGSYDLKDTIEGNVDATPWYASPTTSPDSEHIEIWTSSLIAFSDNLLDASRVRPADVSIFIGRGNFTGPITLGANTTIEGLGWNRTTLHSIDTGLIINGPNTKISGLNFNTYSYCINIGDHPGTVITDCHLRGNISRVAVWNSGSHNASASLNYWGSTDQDVIAGRVHDSFDDPMAGTVLYHPWYDRKMSSIGSLDDEPPVTSITIDGPGRFSDVLYATKRTEISLASSDGNGSGVSNIYYSIDGENPNIYNTPFSIGSQGNHTLTFFALDKLGNAESLKNITVQVWKEVPSADIPDMEIDIDLSRTISTISGDRLSVYAFVTNHGNWTRKGTYSFPDPYTNVTWDYETSGVIVMFETKIPGYSWGPFAYRRIDSAELGPGATGTAWVNYSVALAGDLRFRATILYEPVDGSGQFEPVDGKGCMTHRNSTQTKIKIIFKAPRDAEGMHFGIEFIMPTALAVFIVDAFRRCSSRSRNRR